MRRQELEADAALTSNAIVVANGLFLDVANTGLDSVSFEEGDDLDKRFLFLLVFFIVFQITANATSRVSSSPQSEKRRT